MVHEYYRFISMARGAFSPQGAQSMPELVTSALIAADD